MDALSTSALPTKDETAVGEVTNSTIHSKTQESRRKRKNATFSPVEQFQIGEYTAVHGATAAVRNLNRVIPIYLSVKALPVLFAQRI